jgi:hypothetical protein
MNLYTDNEPIRKEDKIRLLIVLGILLLYMWVDGTMTVLP